MAIDWSNPVAWMLFPASASRLDQAQCGYSFDQHYGKHRDPAYVWENLVFGGDMHNIFEDGVLMKMENLDAEIPVNDLVQKHLSPRIASRAGEMAYIADMFVKRFRFSENIIGAEFKLAFDINLQPCGYNDAICNACGTVVADGIPKGGKREDYPACPSCGSWTHPQPIFRGIIDVLELVRVIGGAILAVVTDHKTQMNLLDAEDLERHFQIVGYAVLVSIAFPETQAFRVQIYFARYGVTRWYDIGQDHFARWKTVLRNRLKRILAYTQAELETASPCSYCDLCEYKPVCPAITGWLDELGGEAPEIMTDADAERVAQRWIALKALVADYEKALKARVAESGPIDLGQNDDYPVVRYTPVEGHEFPLATIYPLLLDAGVTPEEMGNLNGTTIKAKVKKLPNEVQERIFAAATPKLTTRFESKKTNPMDDKPPPKKRARKTKK